jgi:hypothetical protein
MTPLVALKVRRNVSLGNISMRPNFSITTPRTTPYLSPQVGIDQDILADALAMTSTSSITLKGTGSGTDAHSGEVSNIGSTEGGTA